MTLLFMFGHDFDVDDIVFIKGTHRARIIRQGPTKTVFHMLDTDLMLDSCILAIGSMSFHPHDRQTSLHLRWKTLFQR